MAELLYCTYQHVVTYSYARTSHCSSMTDMWPVAGQVLKACFHQAKPVVRNPSFNQSPFMIHNEVVNPMQTTSGMQHCCFHFHRAYPSWAPLVSGLANTFRDRDQPNRHKAPELPTFTVLFVLAGLPESRVTEAAKDVEIWAFWRHDYASSFKARRLCDAVRLRP